MTDPEFRHEMAAQLRKDLLASSRHSGEVVPTRGDRVLAWVFVLIVLSSAAALAAAALCGAAVVVKLTADFLTH